MKYGFIQAVFALPFSFRQRRLAKQRNPISELEFVKSIQFASGDEEAAVVIRRILNDWIYVSGFTPHPEDKLSRVFGIAEEELDEDLILEVFKRLELKIPPAKTLAAMGAIDTPLQIAQLARHVRTGR